VTSAPPPAGTCPAFGPGDARGSSSRIFSIGPATVEPSCGFCVRSRVREQMWLVLPPSQLQIVLDFFSIYKFSYN
jgi:hypothetical protein